MINLKAVPEAIRRLFVSQNSSVVFYKLYDITFSDGTALHLVGARESVTYNGVTYIQSGIAFTAPKDSNDSNGQGSVSICVVDQSIKDKLLELTDPPTIRVVSIFDTATGTCEEVESYEFTMINVTWDGLKLNANLAYDMYLDLLTPSRRLDRYTCPGCF